MSSTIQAAKAAGVNPYPGLRPFEPWEAYLFFGREKQTSELMRLLRQNRFVAVVGSSGSGKSSLVRAGLIPALQGDGLWRVAVLRPGDKPMANLSKALYEGAQLGRTASAPDLELDLVETTLRSSSVGLSALVKQSRLGEAEKLLVLVDQFEELFRYRPADQADYAESAGAFVKLLLSAAADPLLPVYIVITMRADFIGNCASYPGLPKAVSDGQFLVPYPTRQELRRAITEPAVVAESEITPRLVVRLLNEAGEDPDQLPVLQHALMRSWDYWQQHHVSGEALDFKHYEAIGTMRSALSQHAEEAYSELKTPTHQRAVEQAFRALVETDEQGRIIRRPTTVDQICAITGEPANTVQTVMEHFQSPARAFVILRSDSFLDLSHESLIRTWTRLKKWAAKEAQAAKLYERLAASAKLHAEKKESLWRNPQLALAEKWLAETQPNKAWADRYEPDFDIAVTFLKQSRLARRWRVGLGIAAAVLVAAILAASYIDVSLVNKGLSHQLDTYRRQKATTINDIAALQNQQAQLTHDVSSLTAESVSLASQAKALHEQSNSLTRQQHEAALVRDAGLSELGQSVYANDSKIQYVLSLSQQDAALVATLQAANAQNRQLMARLIELGVKMPSITPLGYGSAASMGAAGAPSRVGSAAFVVAPDSYLDQLLKRNANLLAQAQQLRDQNQQLSEEAAALRQQDEKLSTLKAKLSVQVAELNGELKQLASLNELRQTQITDLQNVTKSLSDATASLTKQSGNLDKIRDTLSSTNGQMGVEQRLLNHINDTLKQSVQKVGHAK
jgi:energy-coupling factor transporter ATP-binding protein EcfA2